jgi:aspartate kinase
MSLLVKKFGGTSLENISKIKSAAKKVAMAVSGGDKIAVVVSAMSGTTNKLVSYCSEISKLSSQESFSEYDAALSSGEIITASLFALALQEFGIKAQSCQAWQVGINTTDSHAKALITSIDVNFLNELLEQNIVPVITGFQGMSQAHRITTLGRGGSDTTASAVAAAISADMCEIYTDVDGVYSADPRMVHHAKKIDFLSYEEMLIFAICGAKVLHPRSVQIAMKFGVPLKVLSSFEEGYGTIITNKEKIMEKSRVTGVAYNNNIALVSLLDKAFLCLNQICNVGLSVENISYSGESLSFTLPLIELAKMKEILDSISPSNDRVRIRKDVAIISVVAHVLDHEILAKIIQIIGDDEVLGIITSEVKVSLIVKIEDLEHLVNRLHDKLI